MRGVFISSIERDENGDLSLKGKIREEMINKLAEEWNTLNAKLERESFRSQEDLDAEADYFAEMAEDFADTEIDKAIKVYPNLTKSEINDFRNQLIKSYMNKMGDRINEMALRMEVIEQLLSELGARMLRPYEHWNEEEKNIEYLESRYDYDMNEHW